MKIDSQRRLHGPWHYDQVIDSQLADIAILNKFRAETTRALRKEPRDNRLLSLKENIKESSKIQTSALENLRAAHPFLIGPATLESLMEEEPKEWDFIENGKLPFDNIFFDFTEPTKVKLPFGEGAEGDLIGVGLHKKTLPGRIEDKVTYALSPSLLLDGKISGLDMVFSYMKSEESEKRRLLLAGIMPIGKKGDNERYLRFTAIPELNYIYFEKTGVDKVLHDFTTTRSVMYSGEGKEGFSDGARLLKENEFLRKIPNLCVNLINYINAHNIRVVAKARKSRKIHTNQQFVEEPSSRKPFYLITVESGEVDDSRESGKSWTLNWREAVRGHDRKYRDDKGYITKITWIEPYIRGPEGAPWRPNRYEVNHALLGEKILREREMHGS